MEPSSRPASTDPQVAPGAWYMLSLLFLVYMFSSLDRMVIGLIVEPLKESFQISDAQVGLLSGFAFSVPFAIASLPVGLLVDRLSRPKLLGVVLTIWSVMTALCAGASTFATLVIARMAVGAAEAGAVPAGLSIISDSFPPKRRGTAVGIFYSASQVGQVVLFLGGAWLLTHTSWHAVFLIAGLPGLILAALLFFTTKDPLRGRFDADAAAAGAPKAKLWEVLKLVLRDAPIRYTVLANTIGAGVGGALGFWAVSFFVRVHGVSRQEGATIVGVCLGIVGAMGALFAGLVIDRIARGDPRKTSLFPAGAAILTAVAGLVMISVPDVRLAIGAYAVLCFVMTCYLGPGNLLLLGVTPSPVRGSVTSVNKLSAILLGGGVFSWMAGFVSDRMGGDDGIRMGLVVVLAWLVPAALFFFLAGRGYGRRVAAAAA